ncbi:MAG: LacI family DNA-binding transcriptional regulator [Opitutaceae bacterium]|nr:LacI family DNA-binding transcriptional regulator [Opitutaceae bacterium]
MKPKPTMEDVARASGYSRAAVSLALRGDSSIPESTRGRITAVARKLGYSTNPLISALMSLQRQRRPIMDVTTSVAYLTHTPSEQWRKAGFYLSMFEGASERLAEMGCRLEEFGLGEAGMTAARLREIWRTRNIHAVIVAPLPHGETHVEFDFSGLAVVGLGMSVSTPVIERVASDHFQSAVLAVDRCAALGYRRIGLVLSRETSRRLDHRWLGGYRHAIGEHDLDGPIPPLATELKVELAAALPSWLRTHRPDVVILGNAELELQAKVPAAVGMVSLGVDRPDGAMAGIFQNYALIGRVAAERALAKLYTNSLGPREEAHLHLVAGTWAPGLTAPGPGRRRRAPG